MIALTVNLSSNSKRGLWRGSRVGNLTSRLLKQGTLYWSKRYFGNGTDSKVTEKGTSDPSYVPRSKEEEEKNQKDAKWITVAGLVADLGLCIGKGVGGLVFASPSLLADAGHSASDVVTDAVALGTLRLANKPPDKRHPYGYGRYEAIGTLAVSSLLATTAIGIGWHATGSIQLASQNGLESTHPTALVIVGFSILLKEWLYRATVKIGWKINSQILLASAWHHRSDALSSILAFVGIAGSAMGMPIVDPLAGVLVSGMILKASIESGWESVKELTDHNEVDLLEKVQNALSPLKSVQGEIRDVHDVRARKLGPYLLLDMHVEVNPMMSVSAAHQAGQRVRAKVMEEIPEVKEVLVHVDVEGGTSPTDRTIDVVEKPSQEVIERQVRERLSLIPEIKQISHIVVHYLKQKVLVEAQIVLPDDYTIKEARKVAEAAKMTIEEIGGVYESHVDLELGTHEWEALSKTEAL